MENRGYLFDKTESWPKEGVTLPPLHCGTRPGLLETSNSNHPLSHKLGSEWASKQVNEWVQRSAWASGPVLTSGFLAVLDHSAVWAVFLCLIYRGKKEVPLQAGIFWQRDYLLSRLLVFVWCYSLSPTNTKGEKRKIGRKRRKKDKGVEKMKRQRSDLPLYRQGAFFPFRWEIRKKIEKKERKEQG